MSLLAGFDIVTEISKAAVEKILKSKINVNGTPLLPPFELSISISVNGKPGTAHLVVTDTVNGVRLTSLDANENAVITITFTDSSVIAGPFSATPLSGTLSVSVPLRVTGPGENPPNTLIADLSTLPFNQNSCQLIPDPGSFNTISKALVDASIPLSEPEFISQAQGALELFFSGMGPVSLVAFSIIRNSDGDILSNPPVYEFVKNHNISDQALALFFVVLAQNDGAGNVGLKSTTAIPADQDIAISMSPQVFHRFFFCPKAATKFNVQPSQLPATCGSGVNTQGVTLTNIADSFDTGHINIDGVVEKSGFCYSASGTFHTEITILIQNNKLLPQSSTPQVNVSVDISWYCVLAGLFVSGYIGGIVAEQVTSILLDVLSGVLEAAIPIVAPTIPLKAVNIPQLFTNVTFIDDAIASEGVTLSGKVNVIPPAVPEFPDPTVSMMQSVATIVEETDTGTYDYQCQPGPDCIDCPSHQFVYTNQFQSQTITLQAVPVLLGRPVTYEWWIGFDSNKIPLFTARGLKQLWSFPSIRCRFLQALRRPGKRQSDSLGMTTLSLSLAKPTTGITRSMCTLGLAIQAESWSNNRLAFGSRATLLFSAQIMTSTGENALLLAMRESVVFKLFLSPFLPRADGRRRACIP
jgi:hypothetical protein